MKKLAALLLAVFCFSALAMAATPDVKAGTVQPKKKIVVKKVKKIKKVAQKCQKCVVAPVVPAAPKK